MQFFPSNIFGAAAGLASGTAKTSVKTPSSDVMPFGQSGSAVNKLKQSAYKMAAGTAVGAPVNADSTFRKVLDKLSVYNENNSVGTVPLTTASTRDKNSLFNSEDFKVLKNQLLEMGVSEDVINQYFTYMAATKSDLTIGDMRAAASELISSIQPVELNKQESVQFSAMLSKLGFDNDEIAEIENLMAQGNGLEVLKKIQDKIGALTEIDEKLEISRSDLDILLKACNIQADMREPIIATLESLELVKDDMLLLSPENFKKLFSTTMATLEKRELDLQDLQNNLNKAIEAMLAAKKQRPEEVVADLRGSALSSRSETMSKVLATLVNKEADEEEESSTSHLIDDKSSGKTINKESIVAAMADDKMTSKATREERGADIRAGIRGEAKAQHNTADIPLQEENTSGSGAGEEKASDKQAERRDSKAIFTGQQQSSAEADPAKSALNSKVQEAPGLVFSAFGQTENSASSASQSNQAAKTEIYHERIFEQVERGIVKNATDGSKQIVLRLDPPELGKLTLSLTVAQGEVKAVIRTESAATTQVVSEQLAQLKQSLEEQGFKVSNLEVETRAQSHAGTDSWNGTEQHNHEQQVLEQARFLRLARVRANEGNSLAQSVQHMEHPASISASGLHIIA